VRCFCRLNDPVEADVDEGVDMGGDANHPKLNSLSPSYLFLLIYKRK